MTPKARMYADLKRAKVRVNDTAQMAWEAGYKSGRAPTCAEAGAKPEATPEMLDKARAKLVALRKAWGAVAGLFFFRKRHPALAKMLGYKK